MPQDTIIALIGFAFVMSISPGPGNFLLLASGVNFGFLRSLPLILGISFGFLAMVFGVGMGLGQVLQQAPFLYTALKFTCAAYVLWLAFKVARSRSAGPSGEGQMERPISFLQAALFQLLNPKAWAVALIVTVSYTNPDNYLPSLTLMIFLFALVNLPAIAVWAIAGVALNQILKKERQVAVFNLAMALLLVGSMIPVLLGSFS